LVFTEQPLDVQHHLDYTSFSGSFRNGRRPLFPGACKPLIWHLNRALAAMLLALFLAAIQFSPARVLCVYSLPYLVINAWLATPLLQLRFPDLVHPRPHPHPPGAVAGGH
jgi:hypothetical protein